MGFFSKLKEGLTKTRDNIVSGIDSVFSGFSSIDDDFYDELEETLIMGDIGVVATEEILDDLKNKVKENKIKNPADCKQLLIDSIKEKMNLGENAYEFENRQSIVMLIGVNGVGKTTSVGKLAGLLKAQNKKVIMAAADTFRAAAIEQLTEWSNRTGADIIAQSEGSDPAAVIYDSIAACKARKADVLLCDTAGRLQNKKNLMEELRKIDRVIEREYSDAYRENLIVLDATTGQNALSQLREFNDVTNITGIILTKMDGTAKGGIAVAIQAEFGIPVKYIGVGEKVEDLQKFDSHQFVEALFEENGEVYLVREYIEGMSLAQMVLQKGGISEAEICRISRKICQTAEQFQNPDEPMIHRDIKPENIVVTPGGEVVFIDFGTMRSYKKDGSRDTFVVGTRGTAAPEQYGYTQTDQRTDVYAIGQTMLYMVSESYEKNQLSECAVSRRMKKIIEKACSFEPDKRYGDAAQLRRAVEKCQANNRKKVYKKAGAVFGLIAAGYILAIFSPDGTVIENKRIETAEQSAAEEQIQAEITFREELIEEAVRKELGLSKTDKITASMLEDVRKLRIVGKEILDDEDTFWGEGHHVDGKDSSFGSVRGNITDLSDLAQMVNLEELALCNQKIEDISGLKELPLKKLYLSKNMITDFSVLLNLIDMDTLCIMENPAENLSVIGECTGILRLNIQGMNLTDIDFLKNLSLDYLDMSNVEVENNIFEPLTEMKKLDTLCMCDVNEAAAETLSQMSTLKALFMWGDSTILENLKPLKGMTHLETLAFTTQISSLEGIEQFPSLNFLSVSFSPVKDLSPVTGAKNLQVIDISNADIKNFEPLFGHSGLTEVHCTEEQKEEIMKIDSSPDFEIYT